MPFKVEFKNKEDEEKAKRLYQKHINTINKIKKMKNDIISQLKELRELWNKEYARKRQGDPYPNLKNREEEMERIF